MSKKDSQIFIAHILECLDLISQYSKGKRQTDFLASTALQDAIIRRLEVIGEAVKNLAVSLKTENPEVPWKKIAGMRDILIHEYFGVDLELTWEVVKRELPKLKKQILKIKKELDLEKLAKEVAQARRSVARGQVFTIEHVRSKLGL